MWDMNDLALYAAVVANGGVDGAARALGGSRSRIGRRIAVLESELGIQLIERTANPFQVTAVGQDVYRHARAAVAEAESILATALRLNAESAGPPADWHEGTG
jgi:DNA-binding transcriptional LysR family regulator